MANDQTPPSFRMHVAKFEDDWAPYRCSLPEDKQYAYDEVIDKMYGNAARCADANNPNPVHGMLLSVLVEQQKELMDLQARLSKFENTNGNRVGGIQR